MNSFPDLITQAEMRYRADRIFDDWAPVRRRRRRRNPRHGDSASTAQHVA